MARDKMRVTEWKMDRNIIILVYIVFIGPLSVALFLYGFFPLINYDNTIATHNNVPKFIENVRIKTDTLYQPVVKRLIIMVIDALRWDFVTGSVGKVAMPITTNLIANGSVCLLRAKVQPPTVTMPRIKAITTGVVPSFIDVALNFGSKPITGDNMLLQAKRNGHKLVFYGDNTWLTLFPSIFNRYDGTTSFVVTDFTEVDNNVTRHLDQELYNQNDWSIMILHYLGLDHIGHVHGPFSPFIKTKLKEMDDVIATIQSQIQTWNQNNVSSLFIVCGDHGMKDSGGHGGSTISETTVPFIAIGGKCSHNPNQFIEISQIDIASTLSVILGVPIPFSNIGTVFADTLYDLPISKKLYILYYNAKQVFYHFQKLADYESLNAYQKYLKAVKLHSAWLNTKDHSNDMINNIVFSYKTALKEMKEVLINSMIKYDFQIITIAISFLCHITCILMGKICPMVATLKRISSLVVLNILSVVLINFIWQSEDISLLNSRNLFSCIVLLFILTILVLNSYILSNIKFSTLSEVKPKKLKSRTGKQLFIFGALVHAISLGGSSFIEEEHQTWYFYWVTILTVLLYNSAAKYFFELQFHKSCQQHFYSQNCIKLFLLLVGHRILRKLNSTGDKYAHLPDIAGYLIEQESMLGMTIILVAGLALLIWIDFTYGDKTHKQQTLITSIIASSCIYLRHMHNNSVLKIPFYPLSSGIYEMQIFWSLLAISCSISIYRSVLTVKYEKTMFLRITLFSILRIWVMISAMIHQPHNVILLPLQIIFSSIIHNIIKDNSMREISVFLYAWIGNVFYFYQGNSNSLATIDVAAGYVGVQSYMPLINGSLMLINIYSASVLAYLLLVYNSVSQYLHNTPEIITWISKMYLAWKYLPLTIYTVIISIQRHHLFVWSVFSPKLLYEAVHSTVICFIVFIILILIIIQKAINCDR
nr:PREDICTED: GPI ethanolamine phosphate transferase 2 isoform X1 [Megachile rotundata]